MRVAILCIALGLALGLTLSGCGLLAEVGVLDESYKGSFIRGDGYAALCDKIGGTWTQSPAKCDADLF